MIMDRGFLFFLLLLEWNWINTASVPTHHSLFNSKDLQHINTNWHRGDVQQSSPQERLRRQVSSNSHQGELEIPSSNIKRFKVSLISDLYESSKEITVVLAEYGTQLIGTEPFRIIFDSSLPQNSTQEYVDKLIQILKTYLQEELATTSKRSVDVSLQKTKDGNIAEATITISVNTKTSQIEYLRVDLSKPNVDIRQAVLTSLITTIKSPRASRDDDKELCVLVTPPIGADNVIVQHITNTFRHVLMKLTKSSDISINTFPNENSDGSISEITYKITIGSISRSPKNINIDLSEEGSDFSGMLRNILPTLREQVMTYLISGGTVTFSLEIQPPMNPTNDLSESYHNKISSELQKVFPDYSVTIRRNPVKLPDKLDLVNVGLILFVVTIHPRDSIGDIDLSHSDATERFTKEVEKTLTNLIIKINKEYPNGGTVFFNLRVQIPKELDDISLDNIINQIRMSIMKALENEDRKINLKITENFLGNIMNLKITLIIDPKPVKQSDIITITLDLSTSGDNIEEKLKLSMADTSKQISQKLIRNLPAKLKFVIPSSKESDDVFVDNIKSKINLYVSRTYRNHEIEMKSIKHQKGDVVEITVFLTIRPISRVILTVNLTPMDYDLRNEMSRIIQNINRELSNNHNKEEPYNIGFDIQVSQNVAEQQIENITDYIVTTITKALPEYLVNVVDRTVLNFEDGIVHLYALLSIKSQQQIYVLDLTSSGSEMIEEVSQILLKATNQFEEYSTEGKSENFVLNIYPPNNSTEDFVKNAQDSIYQMAQKLLPNYKIKIKVKEVKDSRDNVFLFKIFFSFQPNLIHSSTTNTPPTIVEKTTPSIPSMVEPFSTTTDRSVSNTTIEPLLSTEDEITTTHEIENETEDHLQSAGPLVLEDFNRIARNNTIIDPGLSKQFRDSIGIISREDEPNIILHIADGSLPHEISDKIFNINLNSSGTIDSAEVTKILEILQFDISDELKKDLEVDLKVNIEVPVRITSNAIRNISQPLIAILRNFFPNNRITSHDTQKIGTHINLGVTIQPAAHIHMNINMLQTRDNIIDIIHEKISRVVSNRNFRNNVHSRLTATIVLNIKPPKKKKKRYLQVISEALVLNMKEYFPRSKIYVKIFTKEDSQDYLTEIHILITVGPSDAKYIEKVIDIDLNNNNRNVDEYIDEKLPDVIYHASIHLAEGLPINLNFNIKFYDKFTQKSPNWVIKKITDIIKINFPRNKINVRTENTDKTRVSSFGVLLQIIIEPLSEKQSENFIQIVLPKDATELLSQINRIIPNIIPDIKTKLNIGLSVTLYFNIIPPKKSSQIFLNVISETLVTTLQKYLPSYDVKVQITSQKNDQGYLTNIFAETKITSNLHNQKLQNVLAIDLAIPRASLSNEISKVINKILNYVKVKLKDDAHITLSVNVIPPQKSSEKLLNVISEKLVTSLQNHLPSHNIDVKLTPEKNNQEYLSNILAEIIIEPNFPSKKHQNILFIDLSKPGASLPNEFNRIINKIIHDVKMKLKESSYVTLYFKVIPPNKSNEKSLNEISEALETIFQSYLSSYKINVRVTSQKNSQQYLTSISAEVNIEPNSQKEKRQMDIPIDLSHPGTSPSDEISKVLNKIKDDIKKTLKNSLTANLYLNLKPPKSTKEKFLNLISETLLTSLKNYFPSYKIDVMVTSQKNNQGYLTNILAATKIKQNPQSREFQEGLHIDLSQPGASSSYEIKKNLNKVINDIKRKLKHGSSATLYFNITPPNKSSEKLLDTISDIILTSLQNYLPSYLVNVEVKPKKNSQGYLTNIAAEATISKTPQVKPISNGVSIDLSQPGASIPYEIIKALNKILNDIKKKLEKSSSLTLFFNVKPPNRSKDELLHKISETLVTSLRNLLPSCQTNVKVQSQKDSQGYLTNIHAETTISKNPQVKSIPNGVSIDLSQPGASISYEIITALNKILNDIKKKLEKSSSLTLYFNVRPPNRSRDELLHKISETLVTSLRNLLPSCQTNVKVQSQKDSQGYLTNINAETTISKTLQVKPIPNGVSIDLSQPGASIPYEIIKALNKILNDIKKKLEKSSSLTLYFNVRPPNRSRDELLHKISETLVTSLRNLLPSCQTNVRVQSQKDSQGYLTNIHAETTISKTPQVKPIPNGVSIDLSQPGTSIPYAINKALNKILNDIKKKLEKSPFLTLYFYVIPATRSTDKLLNTISETLVTSLRNLLPSCQTNVKVQSQKDSQGYLTNILAETTISKKPQVKPIPTGVSIDLSHPGANIPYEINEVLNKILNDIKKKLEKSSSLTLYFNVRPPNRSRDELLHKISETLVTSLRNLLPSCQTNVKVQQQRDSQGYVTNIHAETTISKKPQVKPIPNGVSIDLSQPGASIPYEIIKALNKILNDIKKKLEKSSSLTLYFNVRPPNRSRDELLHKISETLVTSLRNLLPSCQTNVKVQSQKDSQGYLTNILAETTISKKPQVKPIPTGVSIDLSHPGANIPYEINEVLNKILNDIKKKLEKSSSLTLYFNVRPPNRSRDELLHKISETLVTSLRNLLPSCQTNVKVQQQRDSQGYVTNIHAETTISKKPQVKPIPNGVSIDLSHPEASIAYEINKALNKILNDIKKKLVNSSSATLHFNVIPPKKSTDKYVNVISETLVTSLQKLLPSCQMKVKVQSHRDSQGYLTNIHAETDIKQNPQLKPIPNGVSIDLSQPGASIPYEINKALNKILNDIKKKLEKSSSLTLYFNVIPPNRSRDKLLHKISETLVTSLRNLLPSCQTNVKVQPQRDSQGYVTNIHAQTTISQKPHVKPIPNGVSIDLSLPGASIPYEINKALNKILNDIKKKLVNSSSATLHFNVIPPKKSTDKFANVISETLVTSLQKLLPSRQMKVKVQSQRDSQGYLTNIHAETDIKQNPQVKPISNGVSIDLSHPGTSIPYEINKALNKILNDIKKKLDKSSSASLHFNVIPPQKSTDKLLTVISETLVTSLQKLLPSCQMKVKVQSQRDSQGYLTNILLETDIKQNPQVKPIPNGVSIDLSHPGTSIPYEINKALNKILNDIKKKYDNSSSATLYINLKPPMRSTDEFLNVISETLVTSLQNLFSSSQINVKVQSQRDSQGYLTNIHAETDIIKNPQVKPIPNGESIDLSQPGASIPYEINKALNKILNDIKKKLDNSSSATLYFNVKPPRRSTDEFLNVISETLVTSLQNLYSSSQINVKLQSQKDSQGYLTKIHAETEIKQNPQKKTIPNEVSIDLSHPGASIPYEINKGLNKILNDIKKKFDNSSSATLYFNVKPPRRSTDEFLNVISETLVTSLQNLFSSSQINVKLQSQRDSQGYLTKIHAETEIKQNPQKKPIPNEVSIDLSHPGASIPYEINKALNKILNDIKKKLDNSSSATLYFNVKPPRRSTDEFLNVISETLVTSLQNLFSSSQINVKLQSQRDSQGYLTKIHAETEIKQNPQKRTIPNEVSIDLSHPGASIPYEINKALNKILNDVKKKFDNSSSATLYFNVKPPRRSTDEFLNVISETLVTSLQNLFSSSQINVKLQSQRDSQGYLTKIHAETEIKQNPQKRTIPNEVSIDLSHPGASIPYEINKALNKILNDIKKKFDNSSSATLYFNVKPPRRSTDKFLNVISETLVTSLQNLYSSSQINVKLQSQKDSQGYLTKIHAETEIKQNPQKKPIPNEVSIDLSHPGASIPYEINKALNKILNDIKKKLNNSSSATLYFNVKPPRRSTDEFLNVISETLVTSLKNLYSSSQINVKLQPQKDSQGYLTKIHAETEIKQNPQKRTIPNEVSIDLSHPGASIPYEISKALNKILNDIKKKLDNSSSATLYFNVKPPKRSTDEFLNVISETLVTSLKNLYSSSQINVKLQSQKDSQGYLMNIHAKTDLIKNPQVKPITNGVSIDLSQPGASIPYEINKALNKILNDIKKKLDNSSSATLYLNVKPPRRSTDEFLNVISETLVTSLKNLYSSSQINVKLQSQKDSQGYLTNIHAETDIKQSPQKNPIPNEVSIDLSQPGASIPYEINKALNKILNDIKKKLDNASSATLHFNVKPPRRSTDEFLNVISETLVTSLQNLYSSSQINVKLQSQKDSQGYLTNIHAETDIKQNPQKKLIPNEVSIDLSHPGASIPYEINKALNKILNDIKKKFDNSSSATLYFNVKPPRRSTDEFLNVISETLVTSLQNLYSSSQINVKLQSQKDSQGYLTKIHAETEIKQNPQKKPIPNEVSIDLSHPGASIPYEINKALNKILNDIKKKLDNSSSATLYFNVKPPRRSTDEFLNVISETLVTSLQNLYSSSQINVKLQSQKDSQGYLTKIHAETEIKQNPQKKPIPNEVSIDLSHPGASIPYEINKALNKILNDIKKKLDNSSSATLYFNVKPPRRSTDEFLNVISETLVTSLQNLFSSSQINVKLQSQKDSQGYLTKIHAETEIKQNPQKKPIPNEVSIDLSHPGASIPYEINKALNKILNDIKKKLDNSSSATLYFNVKPPRRSTDEFLNVISETLVTSLQNLYSSSQINVKLQSQKDSQGYLTKIHAESEIKQNPQKKLIPNEVSIDLSHPGASIPYEINKALNKILNDIKKKLDNSSSATLYFNVKPPRRSTDEFLNVISETLVTSLQNLFSSSQINVKLQSQKDSQGYLTKIHAETEIKQNPQKKPIPNEVSIDLSHPGASIPYEINKALNKILNDIKKKLDNSSSATLYFNVKPPRRSTDEFLNVISETLVTSLQNLYSSSQINVKLQSQKDSQGYLTKIHAETEIKQNPQKNSIPNEVSIDLSHPGASIPYEINKALNKILNDIKKKLDNSSSATLYFNVKPPRRSTDEFLNVISETLVTSLQNLYSSSQINVKLQSQKDSQGYLTKIHAESEIKQNPQKKLIPNEVSIDLSHPGASIPYEINKALNKILNDIKKKLDNSSSATLYFNVKPPRRSTDEFLNVISETLVTSLQNLFSSSQINVKLQSQKDSQGYLTKIHAETEIKQNPQKKPIPNEVSIDLSHPGASIPYEINKALNKILNDIKKKLNNSSSATLYFNVKPPRRSTDEFLNVISETLVTSLKNLYSSSQINVKLQSQKDSQGYLTKIHAETEIKQNPQKKTIPNEVSIDISHPGASIPYEINKALNKILNDIKKKLDNSSSATLYFNVKPPRRSTDEFLNVISEMLVTSLQTLLPSCQINLKVQSPRDSQGYLTNIHAETDIIQNPRVKPIPNGVSIDLSQPGASIPYEINKALNKILNDIKKKLDNSSSATLYFNVKPPRRSTDEFLNVISGTLVTSLKNLYSSSQINVKLQSQKDSQGYLTNIHAETDIKQNPQKKLIPNEVSIDLSHPGASIPYEINKALNKILNDIKKKLDNSSSATLYFNVKPPRRSTDEFLNVISETLVTSLQNLFSSSQINVNVQSQTDSQGYLTNIHAETDIKQNPQEKPIPNGVSIDLSQLGASIPYEINKALNKILNDIKKKLDNSSSATLYFNVKPPRRSTDEFLNVISEMLVTSLQTLLPSCQINLKVQSQRDSQGYLTNIHAETDIIQNPQVKPIPNGVSIDLSQPGASIPYEINKALNKILNDIKKKLDNSSSATLYFNVKPPRRSTDEFLNVISETLVTSLKNLFSSSQINVKLQSQKDSQGYLTKIHAETDIKQNPQKKLIPNEVSIDLSHPGASIPYEINKALNKILNDIKKKLDNSFSATLYFNVKPPKRSTDKFLNVISEMLVTSLQNLLPSCQLKVKVQSQIDSQGYLTNILVETDIKQNPQVKPIPNGVSIDLSQPGASFPYEINKALNKILNDIKKKLDNSSSATLYFNVKPPRRSTDEFLNVISETLVTSLKNLYSSSQINVKLQSQKDSQGYLTNIHAETDIKQNPQKKLIPNEVSIDLSHPGASIPYEINKALNKILNDIKKKLDNSFSATLYFNVKPPKRSTDKFLNVISEMLVTSLQNLLPSCQLKVKVQSQIDSQGYLTNILVETDIKQNPQVKPIPNGISIDLSQPGASFPYEINKALNKILNDIKKKLDNSSSATLYFNVKPPRRSTDEFLNVISETLVTSLQNIYSSSQINVKLQSQRDSQGYLTSIHAETDIKQNPQKKTIPNEVSIDLSHPGASIPYEVNKALNKILNDIKKKLEYSSSATLYFNVKPPRRSTDEFLKVISETLVTSLQNIYSSSQINVKLQSQRDSQGYLTNIHAETDIKQNPQKRTIPNGVSIDLSHPGASVPYEINKALNDMLNVIKKKLENSSSAIFHFNIVPPNRSSDELLKVISETLVTSLQNLLPSCQINVKVQHQRDSRGQLTYINAETNIKRNHRIKRIENGISIDLSQRGVSSSHEISKVLNEIINDIRKELQYASVTTLSFNVIPPEKSNEQFLDVLSKILIECFQNRLPSYDIKVKVTSQKNSQGYLTNIFAETTIKPNQDGEKLHNSLPIDLSQTGTSSSLAINKVLNKILNDVKKKLEKSSSTTLYFNVIPPNRSNEQLLNVISETLVTSLQNLLPSYEINVKFTSRKNNQGYLTNISAETIIKPSKGKFQSELYQNGLSIDLSQPGSDPFNAINKILIKITNDVKKKLNLVSSVTMYINLIPPKMSSEKFLNVISETLVTSLKSYLSSCNINVKLTSQKNSQGYLTKIFAEIIIRRNVQNAFPLNLSKPGASLTFEIEKIRNKFMNDLETQLSSAYAATIFFKIIPPNKSSQTFLKGISNTLVRYFQSFLPSSDINVKLTQKSSQGYLTNIFAEISIKSNSQSEQHGNGLLLDLSKPGMSLPSEINKILLSILSDVKKELNDASSVTLFFSIIPPTRASEKFVNVILETLVTSFQSYLPSYDIDVKVTSQKTSQEYLTFISAKITIKSKSPSKQPPGGLLLDLSKPGTSLPYEINKILQSILDDVKKELHIASSVTLHFNIIPPNKAGKIFLKVIVDSIVTSFRSYLPSCDINVKVTPHEDWQGYLTNILAEIVVKPNAQSMQSQTGLSIDLSKPGSSLPNEINRILQSTIKDIKNELNDGSSTTLHFNIIPPNKASEQLLSIIPETLVTSLQIYLPSYLINTKVSPQKNSQGYLTNIFAEITIKPKPQVEQSQNGMLIDLSKAGSSLNYEINKIVQNIIHHVKKELSDASSTTLYFNIIPSNKASEQLLNIIPETLVTTLQRYLPSYFINTKVSPQKNSQGYMTNILAEITIKPNFQSEQSENGILIDLSKAGSSPNYEIDKIIQNIIHDVKNKLNEALSTIIYFNVILPEKSNEQMVNIISEYLVRALKNYLPTKDIKVQIDLHMNDQRYLWDFTLIVTIKPLPPKKTYDKEIIIDLSKHGVDFINLINESLLKVLSYAKNYLNAGSSIMLRFYIIPPPKSQTNFIKRISDLILAIFHKYLPMNNVTLSTNSQKNDHGFLSRIVTEINIQPHNAYLDLSESDIALKQQLDIFLTRIKNTVNDDIRKGRSVILTFNIRLPKKSTQFYQHTILKSLMSTVRSYFPKGSVVETIANKHNPDYLEGITTKVRVTRSLQHTRNTRADLQHLSKQQTILASVLNEELPDMIVKVNDQLQSSNALTLNLNIKPPEGINQEDLEEISETFERQSVKSTTHSSLRY